MHTYMYILISYTEYQKKSVQGSKKKSEYITPGFTVYYSVQYQSLTDTDCFLLAFRTSFCKACMFISVQAMQVLLNYTLLIVSYTVSKPDRE